MADKFKENNQRSEQKLGGNQGKQNNKYKGKFGEKIREIKGNVTRL